MVRTVMVGLASLAVLGSVIPDPAQAQAAGTVTLHNRGQFKGVRKVINGPRQHIEPAFAVRSVTVSPGTQWELCSGSTFSGCRQFTKSERSTVMTVRSVRPIAPVLPDSATVSSGGSIRGQSLRGVASEYFVTPTEGGNRVEVVPGTGEAMTRRAGEFCRVRGWRTSAHERLQTVGGRFYLTDVLCVNTGG